MWGQCCKTDTHWQRHCSVCWSWTLLLSSEYLVANPVLGSSMAVSFVSIAVVERSDSAARCRILGIVWVVLVYLGQLTLQNVLVVHTLIHTIAHLQTWFLSVILLERNHDTNVKYCDWLLSWFLWDTLLVSLLMALNHIVVYHWCRRLAVVSIDKHCLCKKSYFRFFWIRVYTLSFPCLSIPIFFFFF